MTSDEIAAKLIEALEGVRSDLADLNIPMEDYARISNKIEQVTGSAREGLRGGPVYLIDYRR